MMSDTDLTLLVERTGWTLLHTLWQGALVAAVLAAVLYLLRNRSANARYAACLVALLLLTVLPVVTWVLLLASSQPGQIEAAGTPSSLEALLRAAEAGSAAAAPTTETGWVALLGAAQAMLHPALPWLVIGWGLGVMLFSVRLLGGWAITQRLRRQGTRPVAAHWQQCFEALAVRLGVHRPVRLLASLRIEVPMAIGMLRPVVLVPVSMLTGLAPQQVAALLAHELAHIRRHDYTVNLLQSVLETLLFYHPAVWWVSQRLRTEREYACDDLAVAACHSRVAYARALTALEACRTGGALAPAASGGSLLARIQRLAAAPTSRDWPLARFAVVATVLTTAGLLALSACAHRPVDQDPSAKPGATEAASPAKPAAPAVAQADSARDGGPHRQRVHVFMHPDSTKRTVVVLDSDSIDVDVLEAHADSLRRRSEQLAHRLERHLDSLDAAGAFAFELPALPEFELPEIEIPEFDVPHVRIWGDSLGHAPMLPPPGFGPDSLGRKRIFWLDGDSLATPHVFRFDSLRVHLFGPYGPFAPDSLTRHRVWADSLRQHYRLFVDSLGVHVLPERARTREDVRRFMKEFRTREPERLREQAEQLEREAERLRQRAEELEKRRQDD